MKWNENEMKKIVHFHLRLSGIGRCYIEDCMFCLFATSKSDCNVRIPYPLWPYTKNTEHLEPLRQIVTPNKRCFRIIQYSVRIQKPNQMDGKHNLILLNARSRNIYGQK